MMNTVLLIGVLLLFLLASFGCDTVAQWVSGGFLD
jgi:hypothetical protein